MGLKLYVQNKLQHSCFSKAHTKDNHPFSRMGSKLLKHRYLNEPVKENQHEFYD